MLEVSSVSLRCAGQQGFPTAGDNFCSHGQLSSMQIQGPEACLVRKEGTAWHSQTLADILQIIIPVFCFILFYFVFYLFYLYFGKENKNGSCGQQSGSCLTPFGTLWPWAARVANEEEQVMAAELDRPDPAPPRTISPVQTHLVCSMILTAARM